MAQRGRPKKELTVVAANVTTANYEKVLKQREEEQRLQLETLYKDLAKVKHYLNSALWQVGVIDSCETFAEAAFKAGRAYGPLDKANDRLADVLDKMREENDDLENWDDIYYEN